MQFRVDRSMSDKEALYRVRQVNKQDPYSIVILDGGILDSSGIGVVKELRAALGEKPLIVLSGYDASSLGVTVRSAGINALCTNPISAAGLKRAVLNALGDRKN